MIRHIVIFKLKEFYSDSERTEARQEVASTFRSLIGQIPQIRQYDVEICLETGPGNGDILIDSTFDSLEDLKAYQAHPAHQEAVQTSRNWTEHKIIGDYSFEK
jgi:hypothetical protein